MKNEIKTVSDRREEKARMSGDRKAWVRDQQAIKFEKACTEYLQSNPEVGELNRNGKRIFYRFGETYQEFTPESVISA